MQFQGRGTWLSSEAGKGDSPYEGELTSWPLLEMSNKHFLRQFRGGRGRMYLLRLCLCGVGGSPHRDGCNDSGCCEKVCEDQSKTAMTGNMLRRVETAFHIPDKSQWKTPDRYCIGLCYCLQLLPPPFYKKGLDIAVHCM